MISKRVLPWVLPAVAAAAVLALSTARAEGPMPWRDDLTPKDRGRVAKVTAPPRDFAAPERFETMPGGATTNRKVFDRDAFSQFSANLDFAGEESFKLGNALFRRFWVSPPSSTQASDGLGPLFNSRACQNCHLKDGRGHAPGPDDAESFLMRLSVPGPQGAEPEPAYGGQLQDLAVPGLPAEGKIQVRYEEIPVTLADGSAVSLRKPTYTITDLGYGPMAPDVMMSPRVATPMIGLGLLEAIHPGDIAALADADDADGDGISGRMNRVIDDRTGATVLGRFGWKAGQPTIEQQSAHAFFGDMGLSTPLMTAAAGDCMSGQQACLDMPNGVQPRFGDFEIQQDALDLVTFYSRNLAVPARRDVDDPDVLAGKKVFVEAGCPACHQPKFVTRRDAATKELSFQLIWPFTDLLLHDMGEGLADNRPEAEADGREWRTAPLWGIGLTMAVNGHTQFLHDGRARNLLEAILWHGGEAQGARDRVAAASKTERDALIRYLETL
ncbi:di-heme oxidoredictase family protein [Methylobrevis pamukkalensis]|uniref:Cytochrome c n=1 Tax=Methylobrevis pamukkalensis TaxID=1439726 RepID=A0A1E3H6D2_9HYPH|nr:di-heme oxidoredictase family protein [Methylobrevis pamukkalensis]ODN71882.1 Cytochrome c [Methylobrevis pamukkalensis]